MKSYTKYTKEKVKKGMKWSKKCTYISHKFFKLLPQVV